MRTVTARTAGRSGLAAGEGEPMNACGTSDAMHAGSVALPGAGPRAAPACATFVGLAFRPPTLRRGLASA
jgi:hypothetical protein